MKAFSTNKIEDFKKGQRVMYIGGEGVVSSVNDKFVFVKYNNRMCVMVTGDEPYTSQATRPSDLIIL